MDQPMQAVSAIRAILRMNELVDARTVLLDEELEGLRDKFDLPPSSYDWPRILAIRLSYQITAFHSRVRYELVIHRKMLLELYPPSGDDLWEDLQTALHDVRGRYRTARDIWYKFKFLFDGYFLFVEDHERTRLEDARPVLEEGLQTLKEEACALNERVTAQSDHWKSLLTQAGYAHFLGQLQMQSAFEPDAALGTLGAIFHILSELSGARRDARLQCGQLYDEQTTALFHGDSSVQVERFVLEFERYRQFDVLVSEQCAVQKCKLQALQDYVDAAARASSTLTTLGGAQCSLDSLIACCMSYDQMRVKFARFLAHCDEYIDTVRTHLGALERTRALQ